MKETSSIIIISIRVDMGEKLHTTQLYHYNTQNVPVDTPQPNKHAFSSASSLLILAQEISASTVYSDMVEHPLECD